MGYCKILSGGTDGRYNIELDFGEAQKTAILAALNTAINKNALNILQAETEIAAAETEEQFIAAILVALQNVIATGTPAQRANAIVEYQKQAENLAQLKVKNEPLRYKLRQLKFVRASLRKQAQQFNLFQPIQRKQAWCADLTEDRAAGAYVGTLEVKGEPDLVLIQPGARAWIPTDGIVTGREIMSPWQAYWNAAVLPGWQKWKPTYRWGTLTAINRGANTGTVALADAISSAQRLGVNQEATLSDVPFSYMTCNNAAFDVDDRVVVQFQGQDWSSPRIIGFLDNPQPCIPWPGYVFIQFTFDTIGTEPTSPTRQASNYNLVACGIQGTARTGFVSSPTRDFYIDSAAPVFSDSSVSPPTDQSGFVEFAVQTPPSAGRQWTDTAQYGNPFTGGGKGTGTWIPASNSARELLRFLWSADRSTFTVYRYQYPSLASMYFVTEYSNSPDPCTVVSSGTYEYWSDWVFGAQPLDFFLDRPWETLLSTDGPTDTKAFINAKGGNIPSSMTVESTVYTSYTRQYVFDGYGEAIGVGGGAGFGTGLFRYKLVEV